ncbi:MAG: pyridoxal-dependent decarboxylase [Clostridiales bacterium]|nr:pyridoxal-dependent decarboxylase [Clostridiales bacterium]
MMETPCYLIHRSMLDEGMDKLKRALTEYWPNAMIGYSFKTNALPWVLDYMKRQGCHAEVVSEDEYELAEYMGYDRIIYNGPVKGKESFLRAYRAGHIINLDAERELEWLKEAAALGVKAKVGIRVNFDLETMCPGEASGGEEGGRFGFSYENGSFHNVADRLKRIPGVELAGIHLHCSSKTRSLNIYRAIAGMACRIHRECGVELSYVDVGGGYFGGLANKPQYADYLREMSQILKEEFSPEHTMLIVEPGTSLICPPIDYITTVTDVKETNRNHFVVTDGSRIHVDPLMTKKSYFYHIEPADRMEEPVMLQKQVISGFTCMENDRLFELQDGRRLEAGDRIVYEKVGAYTMCLSPLFIGYFPPVYLEEDGDISCVRRKWGPKEYVQQSVIEGNNI